MVSGFSHAAGSSNVDRGSGNPSASAWVSLTLEEHLENFERILYGHYYYHWIKFDDAHAHVESVARNMWMKRRHAHLRWATRIVKRLRKNPWESIDDSCEPDFIRLNGESVKFFSQGTPLFWATLMDDKLMVHKILQSTEVDINAQMGTTKTTALHYAITGGNLNIVEDLLHYGADVCICDQKKTSALHYLVVQKDTMFEVAKQILVNNVDMYDQVGNTMLHYAAMEGAANVVTYLLEEGANVNVHGHKGMCALHCALARSHIDVATHLLEQVADVDAYDDNGESPLHYALKLGLARIVTCLLDLNPNVNTMTKEGETCLHYAARVGAQDVVIWLLQRNAVANSCNKDGKTPLHHAARNGHLNVVTTLLEWTSDVNTMDSIHSDPPHHDNEYVEVTTPALTYKVNVHCVDHFRNTPLHEAARGGHLEIVKHLLQRRANGNALNKEEESPLYLAAKWDHFDVVEYLVKHDVDRDTFFNRSESNSLLLSIKRREFALIYSLVSFGVDVNFIGRDQNNALHLAIDAYGENKEMLAIVKLLRKHEVDINMKNAFGCTPIFVAVAKGHTKVVKELLESKQRIELMEECNDKTLIQIAYDYGHTEIKRLLLQCEDVSRYIDELYRDRQVYVDAANSILVGATFIASVTFASWLQPPLGYTTPYFVEMPSSDVNYVDLEHNSLLRAFWVFNTLSFYFAIGTVVFGARSILPRRQLFIKDIVAKLRNNLLVSSTLLAFSVLFVLIAFGIAGCIVLSPILKFQLYMIVPTVFGGFVSLISLAFLFKSMIENHLESKKEINFQSV